MARQCGPELRRDASLRGKAADLAFLAQRDHFRREEYKIKSYGQEATVKVDAKSELKLKGRGVDGGYVVRGAGLNRLNLG